MKPFLKRLAPWILLLTLLTACIRPSALRQGNSPSPEPPIPSPDLVQNALAAGNHSLSMTVDGMRRTYILHIPPAIEENQPLPLIIVLHGAYGTGRKMQLGLGFDPYADSRGFYVAYPDAYQKPGERLTARWNDGRGTLESSLVGVDDVKFITSLVEEIAAQVPLDRRGVFVTGASNGGMMTYRLGCETRGIFAGIAPVISNIPEPIFETCSPQPPLNFLAINGDADPFVPFEGGEICAGTPSRLCEGGWVVSQSDSLSKFAVANGCDAQPQSVLLPTLVEDGTSIEGQTYANCASDAQVKAYIVHNGGHTWPPREGQLEASGLATGNLDATLLIVDFFLGAAPSTPSSYQGENITYKTVAGSDPSLLMLDVYSSPGARSAPVVIFIHGGSWIAGDKSNVKKSPRFIEFFQKNNAILVSANFRLMQSELSPGITFRDQASDVASMVRWARDHISEYGGDPDRITLFGYSAGAHLVALVGTDERYLEAEGLDISAVDSVMCFDVDTYDIPRAIAESRDFNYPAAAVNLPKYFTNEIEIQRAASPMSYIDPTKKHPAFLVVYAAYPSGGSGKLQELSKRQSELFVQALQTAGVSAILYGDLNLTHTQLVMQFGDPAFGLTIATQDFLDEFFW